MSRTKSVAIINNAIIIADTPENKRVYEPGRAEPAAAEVNVGNAATGDAGVEDLNRVRRNSTRERSR